VRDLRADAASRASREHRPEATTRGRKDLDSTRPRRAPLRNQSGWALVALGLRLVASGSR